MRPGSGTTQNVTPTTTTSQEYFANRIAESRQRALLQNLHESYTTHASGALEEDVNGSYFADRIEQTMRGW